MADEKTRGIQVTDFTVGEDTGAVFDSLTTWINNNEFVSLHALLKELSKIGVTVNHTILNDLINSAKNRTSNSVFTPEIECQSETGGSVTLYLSTVAGLLQDIDYFS